jgi:protein-tyrosine-phosphatase
MLGSKKRKVLFVDWKNELQSQIAEKLLEKLHGDLFESYSAGPEYDYVDCDALVAMSSAGHDLRRHMSKNFQALEKMSFDYIVIMDEASNEVPVERLPPHKKRIVHIVGGRECFQATDDQELFDCYASMIQDIGLWIDENFRSYESVDAL